VLKTILSKITEKIYDLQFEDISTIELQLLKNAVLDRIGCGLGSERLGVGAHLHKYIDIIGCTGNSTIWGTAKKAPAHLAALTNGAISSRLEYDTHDSMIPASLALGENENTSGRTLLESLKTGCITGLIIRRLLAASLEKRGLHWPSYLSGFSATSACAKILNLSKKKTQNALGITASLNPITPFETFTKGASVKDLYGGWGNMLGVQSALLSFSGIEGSNTIFEGERGLLKNWLEKSHEKHEFLNMIDSANLKVKFHFKPYPCCTNAHPTLTAIEKILSENKIQSEIMKIEIVTYKFGVELSNQSNVNSPIGSKVNIPFLAASFLTHNKLLPEHTEYPWISNKKIRKLSERVVLKSLDGLDDLDNRTRSAHVLIKCKNGETVEEYTDLPKWSKGVSQKEIEQKFRCLVKDFFSSHKVEEIINKVNRLEKIDEIRILCNLLTHTKNKID
jgi:2-methylcitrate dehydratase PrpD